MARQSEKDPIYHETERLREHMEERLLPSKEKFQALAKLEEIKILVSKTETVKLPSIP